MLSACTSGYVSGYDEIRQRTASQESARAQKAQNPKAQSSKAQTRKAQARKTRKSPAADKSATSALNKAQLEKARAASRPAPVQRTASRPAAPPVVKAQAQTVQGGTVVVKPGETLFAISRRTGAAWRDIVVAHNLEPPNALKAGQRLTIPAARYHIVRAGETGYSISRAYGTDLTTLARLNGLQKPYAVQVGQRLRLPASPTLTNGGSASRTVASAPAAS